jgi:4'-phosphopantetheinyl transferase
VIFIAERPEIVTGEMLHRGLELLPEWRRAYALRYHKREDQILSVAAYRLLQVAQQRAAADRELQSNLSHCARGAACAIDTAPIGVDIETVQLPEQSVIDYCCNEAERAMIAESDDPAMTFTRVWTRKESYLKMLGIGIVNDMRNIKGIEKANFREYGDSSRGWLCTVCSERADYQGNLVEVPIESLFL